MVTMDTPPKRALSLPLLMSFNGGYVDTAGFLALQGLFTAHVTGNFVTFGAAMVMGASGAGAKLLALPVFCAAVLLSRLFTFRLEKRGLPVLRIMLWIQFVLLLLGSILAIVLAPFPKGDSWVLVATGMTFVCAMAIQNAAHRVHMATAPPTTLMTGTTTQIMLDVAELFRTPRSARAEITKRLKRLSTAVSAFALGCGLAALAYDLVGDYCFLVAPAIGLLSMITGEARQSGQPPSTPSR
jgi:uncharacterized membrane protein YoaK (UPF0700 family)